jgi:hypothetical protein
MMMMMMIIIGNHYSAPLYKLNYQLYPGVKRPRRKLTTFLQLLPGS